MIERIDESTRKRVNKAIANIRHMATRVKRPQIAQAHQRAEIVVTLLNEFRQYVNTNAGQSVIMSKVGNFGHDAETLAKIVQAIFQADGIYDAMTREKRKSFEQEHVQVWSLLENIHTYVERKIREEANHA